MPTVPTADATPIREDTLPNARLTAAPSGDSPIGQGLQAFGSDAHAVFMDQRRKAQATMYADATTHLKGEILHQEWDPEAGWRQKKGADSFGLHKSALPTFDQSVDKIAGQIPDPEVRDQFKLHANDQRVDLEQRLDGWIDQQHQAYSGQVLEEGIKTSQASAALNWQDPARVSREVVDQADRLRAYAASNGLPAEWAQAKIQDAGSTTHGAVIQQMLTSGQDLAAKQYFDQHKADLNAEAQVQLGRAVDYGSTQTAAQAAAAEIYAPGKTLEEMDAAADKIPNQRIQAAAKDRLHTLHATHLQAVDEQGHNLLRAALQVLNTDPRGLAAVPADKLAALNATDPQRYQALVETAQRMTRREDITTEEGNGYFIKIRSALSGAQGEAQRDAAVKEDLLKLSPYLSKGDLKEISDLQDKAKLGKDVSSEHAEEQIAANTLALNDYKPEALNHDGTPNLEAIAFRTALRKSLAADKAAGKKLTPEDVQKTANALMAPQVTGRGIFGGDNLTPIFMLNVDRKQPASAVGGGKASGAYATSLGDFNQDQIDSARAKLKGGRAVPTDDAVLRLLRGQAAGGLIVPGKRPMPGPPVTLPGGVEADSTRADGTAY